MSYSECKTKIARIQFIREQIKTNDQWMLKGLLTIYKYQTESEKADGITKDHNNVGFNGPDSEILSSFAQQYLKNGSLSIKQMNIARTKMVKYARQLEQVAKAKAILNEMRQQPLV